MYPVVRDLRTQNRLPNKRSYHTGGPSSGKNVGATPVKAQSLSPNGLAKSANPVIPVHKRPVKAGTGLVQKDDNIGLKDLHGKRRWWCIEVSTSFISFQKTTTQKMNYRFRSRISLGKEGWFTDICPKTHLQVQTPCYPYVGERRTTGIRTQWSAIWIFTKRFWIHCTWRHSQRIIPRKACSGGRL